MSKIQVPKKKFIPPFLPEEIINTRAQCEKCQSLVFPDLWTRQNFQYGPVYPQGTEGEHGGWFRVSTTVDCKCGNNIDIPIGHRKLQYIAHFYGDEAERQMGNIDYVGYSLLGAGAPTVEALSENLLKIKSRHAPNHDPSKWRIHVMEMWDSRKRASNRIYSNISDIKGFFEDCAELIFSHQENMRNFHAMAFRRLNQSKRERIDTIKEMKIAIHQAILSIVIYDMTRDGYLPEFTLDATAPVKSNAHYEEWSRSTYLNSKSFLAHEFLCHGNDIKPPKFALPGSHPCLELADVHAFFAARTVFKKQKNEIPEISMQNFGNCKYIEVEGMLGCNHFVGNDIPTDWLYKIGHK